MKTPKGEIITQYDLHDCEAVGLTKYDFLVTEVQDKLAQAMRFLQADGVIEDNVINLRSVYDKYTSLQATDPAVSGWRQC